jgi:hypothetical protein
MVKIVVHEAMSFSLLTITVGVLHGHNNWVSFPREMLRFCQFLYKLKGN